MENRKDVLDKGYVILHDVMGSDLTVVNAARVSYNEKSEELSKKDKGLINFLGRENHHSPFRHATMQFEVYAPLMIARQWWKYVTGSTHQDVFANQWNESSRRYVKESISLHMPENDKWRTAPENSKQGSGDPISAEEGIRWSQQLEKYQEEGVALYEHALKRGLAAEQARLFLPAYGLYVRWYWTASLQGVAHFLNQRMKEDAQSEIREYAEAVYQMAKEKFPNALDALLEEK